MVLIHFRLRKAERSHRLQAQWDKQGVLAEFIQDCLSLWKRQANPYFLFEQKFGLGSWVMQCGIMFALWFLCMSRPCSWWRLSYTLLVVSDDFKGISVTLFYVFILMPHLDYMGSLVCLGKALIFQFMTLVVHFVHLRWRCFSMFFNTYKSLRFCIFHWAHF